jgi:hypothetical protein
MLHAAAVNATAIPTPNQTSAAQLYPKNNIATRWPALGGSVGSSDLAATGLATSSSWAAPLPFTRLGGSGITELAFSLGAG